jgi:alpha-ribazole phosphatase
MEIYLIRHTTPAVAKGICYGQTDLDPTDSMGEEAAIIRSHLPEGFAAIHSSPLQRCARLATLLFPGHSITLNHDLMEIHCGLWEMRNWDELSPEELDPWMKDFVRVRIPGGESYLDLHDRVNRRFHAIRKRAKAIRDEASGGPVAIVSHGGPIRSILSAITGTALIDSFKIFSLHYGCVVKLSEKFGGWQYEILSNPAPVEKEQHKPKNW